MNPLDLITFASPGFEPQGDNDGVRVWHSPAGDGVGLHHFSIPPDIEADLEDVDSVRAFYGRTASESGLAIIEVETPTIQECRFVRTMIKIPQQPFGMTYLGSLTFRFRDFSYVLKVQCVERGITGMREAVVFEDFIKDSAVSNLEGGSEEWMEDPYDASVRAPLMRNRSEAQEYDAEFPEHPLTRARQVLGHIETTITIAPYLRSVPPFRYLARRRHPKTWSRRW